MGAELPPPESTRPFSEVFVSSTWSCNLACSYCFLRRRGLNVPEGHMSPELAVRVVDVFDEALLHSEVICLHLYGGEPLTNLPALSAMLRRAEEKPSGRFRFAVTTNGVADPEEAVDLLGAGRFQVILSIDGPEEIHDACRRTVDGAPTHATVLRFLEALRSRTDCWVRASSVVRKGWSLSKATAYLRSLPVDAIKAQAVRLPTGSPHALGIAETAVYFRDLEKIGRDVIEEIEAGHLPRDDRFSSRVLQLITGKDRQAFCGAGETTLGVTPDGTVLPCILLDPASNRLGHVFMDPEEWIREGRRWKESRGLRADCASCSALPLCGGGCPALLPVCGEGECELIRKNCEVARSIHDHFRSCQTALLVLAGVP